jgi:hypothetical protein
MSVRRVVTGARFSRSPSTKRDHETFVNSAYSNRYSDSDFGSPPHHPRYSGLCEIYDMGG